MRGFDIEGSSDVDAAQVLVTNFDQLEKREKKQIIIFHQEIMRKESTSPCLMIVFFNLF